MSIDRLLIPIGPSISGPPILAIPIMAMSKLIMRVRAAFAGSQCGTAMSRSGSD